MGVQGEAEVATVEMTTVTGILVAAAAGVTTVVLGTGIAVEALIMDQRKALAQVHKMEAMGVATMAAATASTEAATEMDSQTLVQTKGAPLEASRTTFRLSSLGVPHKMVQAILPPLPLSPRHRHPSSHHRP